MAPPALRPPHSAAPGAEPFKRWLHGVAPHAASPHRTAEATACAGESGLASAHPPPSAERRRGREVEVADEDAGDAIERPVVLWEGSGPPASSVAGPAAPSSGTGSSGSFAELVRAVAIGGDARRATVRLELGGGALGRDKGALVVHGEGDEVAIDLALGGEGSATIDVDRLVRRVAARLEQKGVRVRAFDVR